MLTVIKAAELTGECLQGLDGDHGKLKQHQRLRSFAPATKHAGPLDFDRTPRSFEATDRGRQNQQNIWTHVSASRTRFGYDRSQVLSMGLTKA